MVFHLICLFYCNPLMGYVCLVLKKSVVIILLLKQNDHFRNCTWQPEVYVIQFLFSMLLMIMMIRRKWNEREELEKWGEKLNGCFCISLYGNYVRQTCILHCTLHSHGELMWKVKTRIWCSYWLYEKGY